MNKKLLGSIAVIVIILILVGILRSSPNAATKTIRIGAPFILSGDNAKYGEIAKRGVDMAVAEYNNKPEVVRGKLPKVEIIYEDTHADPKTAVSVYQKLVAFDNVNVLIGPLFQTEMSSFLPLVEKDKIPVFGITPLPTDKRNGISNPLAVWPDPTIESGQMAQYAYDNGVRTVAVLGTRDPWENEISEGFAKKFTALGGKVVDEEIVLSDSKDTSLPVTRAIASHADAIFLGTYLKFQYFIKKLSELGYKGKLYGLEVDSYLADITKPYSNGVYFISPAYFTPEFSAAYIKLYGENPSIPVGQAHVAMSLLLSLIPSTFNSDPEIFKKNLIEEMGKLKEFNGVAGKVTFTPDHNAIFPVSLFKIDNGIINLIK